MTIGNVCQTLEKEKIFSHKHSYIPLMPPSKPRVHNVITGKESDIPIFLMNRHAKIINKTLSTLNF